MFLLINKYSCALRHISHVGMIAVSLSFLLLPIFILSCKRDKCGDSAVAPWGGAVGDTATSSKVCSYDDIVSNGEIIVATLSGPDTYFEYHGRGFGTQYFLCEKYAQSIGVSLRVEVCKDTLEMVEKVKEGTADIAMCLVPKSFAAKNCLLPCGAFSADGLQWAVSSGNKELAESLSEWYKPGMLADVKREEKFLLSSQSVRRHVFAPFLDRSGGVISKYDNLFRRYAPIARWDWRLLAAQCYQESCFDPNARSWAGACGLMQIMPATADHLGLARGDMTNPEKSIEASVRLLAELLSHFRDVPSLEERRCFVLASYNGGSFHIRDAMALARKYGADDNRWREVAPYVLKLQQREYYTDPVVKNGYMRGSETVEYVQRIRARYAQYRGCKYSEPAVGGCGGESTEMDMSPRRATKKYKYHI